jgi:hypothetical protein
MEQQMNSDHQSHHTFLQRDYQTLKIEQLRKSLKDYPDATLCIDSEPAEKGRKYKSWLDLNDVEVDKEE